MKKLRLRCFTIISLGLLVCFSQVGAAESVELTISSDKTEFALGEPVILYVSLKNTGNTSVTLLKILEPEGSFVDYMIKAPGGNYRSFVPWMHKDYDSPGVALSPGQAVNGEAKIFFGGEGWVFTKPGRYEIRALYEGKISSNTIAITVATPSDTATQNASRLFLESKEVGKFLLFEGGDHLKDGMGRLEQTAAQLPNTPHAFYANYALGANLTRDFANFQEKRFRKADPQRAIQYLQKAKLRPLSAYYTVQTFVSLSDNFKAVGDLTRAASAIEDLKQITVKQFPGFQPYLMNRMKQKGITFQQ